MDSAIILMAKQPQPGKTKTRLCPPLTHEQAASLYEALLKDTLVLAGELGNAHLAVAISPPDALAYFRRITQPGVLLLPVEGETIGVCLYQSFQELFERGYRHVLALNTDGPSLPAQYLRQALEALEEVDLMLGPGEDGGYYLIGMKQPHPALFEGIPWSTGEVLSHTLAQAEQLNLRAQLTPTWYDVDHLPDVLRLHDEIRQLPSHRLVHVRAFFQQHSPETWRA